MRMMYNPAAGYGGDQRAAGYGQTATDEEERRRRAQAGAQQRPTPSPPPSQQAPPQPQQQTDGDFEQGVQAVDAPRPVNKAPQPTFAELQRQGQARPAPPPVQTQGYSRQAQQEMQMMPSGGAGMIPMQQAPQAQGGYNPQASVDAQLATMRQAQQQYGSQWDANARQQFEQQMGALQGQRSPQQEAAMQQAQQMGLDPIAAMMDPEGFQRQMAAQQQFMQRQEQNSAAAPAPFDLAGFAAGQLQTGALPTAPTPYTAPKSFLDQLQQLMQLGRNAPGLAQAAQAAQAVPAGLTSEGVDPVMLAQSSMQTPAQAAAFPSTAQATQAAQTTQGPAPVPIPGPVRSVSARPGESTEDLVRRSVLEANPGAEYLQSHTYGQPIQYYYDGQWTTTAPSQERLAQLQAGQSAPAAAPSGGAAGSPAASASSGFAATGGGAQGAQMLDVNSLTEQSLREALQNPSAFDNAEVRRLYGEMGQNIDDEFAQRQTALREEMAARGLSDSSIMGGRLSDLNVQQRSAQAQLASDLAGQRARDFAGARAQAIGMGQGQRAAALSEEMGRANLGLQGQQLSLAQQNAAFNNAMAQQDFGLRREAQGFNQRMGTADFGLRQNAQSFGQGLQGLQFQNQLGQQGFQNQMDVANFSRNAGNDRFSQNLNWSQFLRGMGQDAFSNDLERARFNQGVLSDQDRFFLQLLGLGG
jgi:hypothetical protein